jgi:hypothetical protein
MGLMTMEFINYNRTVAKYLMNADAQEPLEVKGYEWAAEFVQPYIDHFRGHITGPEMYAQQGVIWDKHDGFSKHLHSAIIEAKAQAQFNEQLARQLAVHMASKQ